jgi:hypothetical protein
MNAISCSHWGLFFTPDTEAMQGVQINNDGSLAQLGNEPLCIVSRVDWLFSAPSLPRAPLPIPRASATRTGLRLTGFGFEL